MYQKIEENGYIISVVKGVSVGNITEAEYDEIINVIRAKPSPPDCYDYLLKSDLSWELYELPPAPDPAHEEISGDEFLNMMEGIL